MLKPIYVIVSLVIFFGSTGNCFAQEPQTEQSSKETATGKNVTPWKTKNLPPEKIDSSVESAPPNVPSNSQTHSTPAVPDNYIFPSWYHPRPWSAKNATPSPSTRIEPAPILKGVVLKKPGDSAKNLSVYPDQAKEHQSSSVNANKSKETTSWHGHLISANSAIVCKNYSNCFDFLNKYDKKTALSAKSQAKGYLLYANDKWYTLDKHGNDLAVKAIKRSIKSKGFYVAVDGELKGNTILVTKLVEIVGLPAY